MKKISKLDEYLFDLNGYLIINNALNKKELKDLNNILDKLKNIKNDEWAGHVHGHNYGGKESFQQVYGYSLFLVLLLLLLNNIGPLAVEQYSS